jgi:hypothetical protein
MLPWKAIAHRVRVALLLGPALQVEREFLGRAAVAVEEVDALAVPLAVQGGGALDLSRIDGDHSPSTQKMPVLFLAMSLREYHTVADPANLSSREKASTCQACRHGVVS